MQPKVRPREDGAVAGSEMDDALLQDIRNQCGHPFRPLCDLPDALAGSVSGISRGVLQSAVLVLYCQVLRLIFSVSDIWRSNGSVLDPAICGVVADLEAGGQ